MIVKEDTQNNFFSGQTPKSSGGDVNSLNQKSRKKIINIKNGGKKERKNINHLDIRGGGLSGP